MPIVSVLIAAYNVTRYICAAIDSVLCQPFDCEIIVVNDGCPDTRNLERALEPYRTRITYLKQANGGPSAARNTAIQAAHAPLVALLDGDDVWEPNYLQRQLEVLREHDADLVYPNMTYLGGPAKGRLAMDFNPSDGEVTLEKLITQRCIVLNGVLMKREIAIRAGLWDPAFRHSEDFDLWLRIAYIGGRIVYHKEPLAYYRVREGSLSASSSRMLSGQIAVYRKALRNFELDDHLRALIQHRIAIAQAEIDLETGRQALFEGNGGKAAELFRSANRILKRRRLAAAVPLLKIAPWAIIAAARIQRRLTGHPAN